jgi:ethanolamine utilization protein EutN
MFIAKVIGNVVATQKNEKFLGMKLLLIQPYISKDGKLQISGSSVVAVDSVGAGIGSACCLRKAVLLVSRQQRKMRRWMP